MSRFTISLCAVLLTVGLLFAAYPSFAQRRPIALTHSPNFVFEPATVDIVARIIPHVDNREVCVQLEGSSGYSRTSCFSHIGEDAPGQVIITYRNLVGGRYTVLAILGRYQEGHADMAFHFANDSFCILSRRGGSTCG